MPLRVLRFHGKLELLVPSLVIEEFDRNRLRSEMAVKTSVLDRLRQLRRELRDYAGEKNEHIWLAETTQHIPLVNATAPQNFREIDALLHDGTIIKPTDQEQVRAAQRGLDKTAPFTSDKNSVADALLIEIYSTQIASAGSDDVYAFVTSNHRDFSVPDGDHRLPHPDLAALFDGGRSRYAYKVEGLHEVLVDYFGDEFLQEYDEVEFLISDEEPRTLAEIVEAENEFFEKVWYVRSIVHEDEREIPEDIRTGMMAARERAEEAYGREQLWKAIRTRPPRGMAVRLHQREAGNASLGARQRTGLLGYLSLDAVGSRFDALDGKLADRGACSPTTGRCSPWLSGCSACDPLQL